MNTLRFLRHFQRSAFSEIIDLEMPIAVQTELTALMNSYISGIVERKLNAPDFIKQVKRSAVDDNQVK